MPSPSLDAGSSRTAADACERCVAELLAPADDLSGSLEALEHHTDSGVEVQVVLRGLVLDLAR